MKGWSGNGHEPNAVRRVSSFRSSFFIWSGNGHEPSFARRGLLLSLKLFHLVQKRARAEQSEASFLRSIRFLLKNNKLAEYIIQDHHDNIRDDLHDEVVYMELVHKDPQKDRLDH